MSEYKEAVAKLEKMKLKMGDNKHIKALDLFRKSKQKSSFQEKHQKDFIELMRSL